MFWDPLVASVSSLKLAQISRMRSKMGQFTKTNVK